MSLHSGIEPLGNLALIPRVTEKSRPTVEFFLERVVVADEERRNRRTADGLADELRRERVHRGPQDLAHAALNGEFF